MAFIKRLHTKPERAKEVDAPFFEHGPPPKPQPKPQPIPLSAREEAESLARWEAAKRRQARPDTPTAREFATVGLFAAALLALKEAEHAGRRADETGSAAAPETVQARYAAFMAELDAQAATAPSPWTWSPDISFGSAPSFGAAIFGPIRVALGSGGPSAEPITRATLPEFSVAPAPIQFADGPALPRMAAPELILAGMVLMAEPVAARGADAASPAARTVAAREIPVPTKAAASADAPTEAREAASQLEPAEAVRAQPLQQTQPQPQQAADAPSLGPANTPWQAPQATVVATTPGAEWQAPAITWAAEDDWNGARNQGPAKLESASTRDARHDAGSNALHSQSTKAIETPPDLAVAGRTTQEDRIDSKADSKSSGPDVQATRGGEGNAADRGKAAEPDMASGPASAPADEGVATRGTKPADTPPAIAQREQAGSVETAAKTVPDVAGQVVDKVVTSVTPAGGDKDGGSRPGSPSTSETPIAAPGRAGDGAKAGDSPVTESRAPGKPLVVADDAPRKTDEEVPGKTGEGKPGTEMTAETKAPQDAAPAATLPVTAKLPALPDVTTVLKPGPAGAPGGDNEVGKPADKPGKVSADQQAPPGDGVAVPASNGNGAGKTEGAGPTQPAGATAKLPDVGANPPGQQIPDTRPTATDNAPGVIPADASGKGPQAANGNDAAKPSSEPPAIPASQEGATGKAPATDVAKPPVLTVDVPQRDEVQPEKSLPTPGTAPVVTGNAPAPAAPEAADKAAKAANGTEGTQAAGDVGPSMANGQNGHGSGKPGTTEVTQPPVAALAPSNDIPAGPTSPEPTQPQRADAPSAGTPDRDEVNTAAANGKGGSAAEGTAPGRAAEHGAKPESAPQHGNASGRADKPVAAETATPPVLAAEMAQPEQARPAITPSKPDVPQTAESAGAATSGDAPHAVGTAPTTATPTDAGAAPAILVDLPVASAAPDSPTVTKPAPVLVTDGPELVVSPAGAPATASSATDKPVNIVIAVPSASGQADAAAPSSVALLPVPDAGQAGAADKPAATPPKTPEAGAVVAVVPVTETPASAAKSGAEPAPIQAVLAIVQTDANGEATITADQVAALQALATDAPQVVHTVKVAPGLQTDSDPVILGLLTTPATTSPEVVILPTDATSIDQAPVFVMLPQPDAIL